MVKKLIIAAITLSLLLALFPLSVLANPEPDFSAERPAYSKGDVDGDGKITSVDYMLVKRIFFGSYTPTVPQYFAADINSDGEINSTDFLMLKRFFYETLYFEPESLRELSELSEEYLLSARQAYAEYLNKTGPYNPLTAEDITVDDYFTVNDDCTALFIRPTGSGFPEAITEKWIAKYRFIYPTTQELLIFDGSDIHTLDAAFDNGIISKEDVYHLRCNYMAEYLTQWHLSGGR